MSGVLPGTDFMDADLVRKLIQAEDYFSGSSNPWSSALDDIVYQELALSALGALLKHLSRFMVRLPECFSCRSPFPGLSNAEDLLF